jgi:hypothetical protein
VMPFKVTVPVQVPEFPAAPYPLPIQRVKPEWVPNVIGVARVTVSIRVVPTAFDPPLAHLYLEVADKFENPPTWSSPPVPRGGRLI